MGGENFEVARVVKAENERWRTEVSATELFTKDATVPLITEDHRSSLDNGFGIYIYMYCIEVANKVNISI